MNNYYEELQLEIGASAESIHDQLLKLQRVWIQRQINSPEKALAKLLLISEALEVFKTETARSEYDEQLAKASTPIQDNEENAAEKERLRKLVDYHRQATDFFIDHKFDLAKTAVDNTLRYFNPSTDELYFKEYRIMTLAAWIYLGYGDYQGALKFNNEAMVSSPSDDIDTKLENLGIRAYAYKNLFLDSAERSPNYYSDPQVMEYYREALDAARKAYSLSNQASVNINNAVKMEYTLCLAELLAYTNENSPEASSSFSEAQELARKALKMGDASGLAQEIIERCQETPAESFQAYQGSSHPVTRSGSGCYVATAVYGSYDCPEVWVLRRFRDNYLSTTFCGRLFIRLYYLVSPTVVRVFGKNKWFTRFFRKRLDRLVSSLESQGFSNEAYYDRL